MRVDPIAVTIGLAASFSGHLAYARKQFDNPLADEEKEAGNRRTQNLNGHQACARVCICVKWLRGCAEPENKAKSNQCHFRNLAISAHGYLLRRHRNPYDVVKTGYLSGFEEFSILLAKEIWAF